MVASCFLIIVSKCFDNSLNDFRHHMIQTELEFRLLKGRISTLVKDVPVFIEFMTTAGAI